MSSFSRVAVKLRAGSLTSGPNHGPLLRPPPGLSSVFRCSTLAPYRVFPSGRMPEAHHFGRPPWCSSHLRGLRSAGVRCPTEVWPVPLLGIRVASVAPDSWVVHAVPSMAPLMTSLLFRLHPLAGLLTVEPGLQRLPPGKSRCLLSQSARRLGVFGLPPSPFQATLAWAWRPLQRGKPPGLFRAALQGVPRCLTARSLSLRAPATAFLTPLRFWVQPASVADRLRRTGCS